ncbi:Tripeptidyl peptidase a [Pleurostoma richardsiae]|uniref:tripeptidyl-peptidase II n=1 Tax=Pleurostoma richardsiae TaxID=41990 RepID=A0AA38RTD6_9PEZI|nr:Tripeptidyl peptidase a [Pleurostoma richardsiae]
MKRGICLLAIAATTDVVLGGVHEQLAAVPHGWSQAKAPPSNDLTTFTVVLNRDFASLEDRLLGVSTPGHSTYGKFLDNDEVETLFAPPTGAVSAVVDWLKQGGVSDYKIDGSFIDFATNVAAANALLNASYQYYSDTGSTKLRTLQYSIPDELQTHVAFIDPGVFFGQAQSGPVISPSRTRRRSDQGPSTVAVDASCQTSITPSCLKELYSVGNYKADPRSGSRIGFGSFLNQSAIYSDLEQFEELFGIPSQNFTKVLIANGTDDQDPSHGNYGEANLDVQTVIGVAHPLPVTEFITGGSPPFIPTIGQPTPADNFNEPYVPFLRYLLSRKNSELPQVISISYGDQEDGVPFDYATLTCNLVGLLGLRGITVLSSSGDGGLGGACLAPDFTTVEFGRLFPASCPYITAVGGTSAASNPEVAWNQSGGGFSGYFDRPWYQEATIRQYLAQQVSPQTREYYGNYTNFSGRAWPDVAAHSLYPDFEVVYAGAPAGSGGTSASAPTFAGIVGLLNDARLRVGKAPLGFLNPLIYSLGKSGFNDVVEGYTYGCLGQGTGYGAVPGARWNATAGWDPTTGFGTPNFKKLKDLVLKL